MKMMSLITGAVLVLSLLSPAARAEYDWQAKYVSRQGKGIQPSLAFDPDGNPRIAHASLSPEGETSLLFTCLVDGDWVTEAVDGFVVDGVSAGDGCSLAIDDEGNCHISYTRDSTEIRYAFRANGEKSWNISEVYNEEFTTDTTLALDVEGKPHLVFTTNYPDRLIHAYINHSGVWGVELIDEVIDVRQPSAAVASDGTIYVLYIKFYEIMGSYPTLTTGVPTVGDDKYSWSFGHGIHGEMWDSISLGNALALDTNDTPHIVRYYPGHGGELEYYTMIEGVWVKEIIDEEGDAGEHCSITVDFQGTVYIAYNSYKWDYGYGRGALKVAFRQQGSSEWQIDVVDNDIEPTESTGGLHGAGTSIRVDGNGTIGVAYFDDHHPSVFGRRYLKFARGMSDTLGFEIVETTNGVVSQSIPVQH